MTDLTRGLYLAAGWLFVALAAAGVVLPLLPTTPFLLLASSCFLRSSPRARRWLYRSRLFGPMLRDWDESRAVRRPVKVLAIVVVAAAEPILIESSAGESGEAPAAGAAEDGPGGGGGRAGEIEVPSTRVGG